MGWASAGGIFDPVAQGLINAGASDDVKIQVLTLLIKALKDGDWDTEDESLDQFRDDPAIVEAFRRNGVYDYCDDEHDRRFCELEKGHTGDHDNKRGWTWPHAATSSEQDGAGRG